MIDIVSKIITAGGDKRLKKYQGLVSAVNNIEPEMAAKTDAELRLLSDELKSRASNGEKLEALLVQAFALVREASKRTLGLRHYDVQLIGAMALNDGCIAEMKTGEGKTLVSTAAAFLNALSGNNVHVVTVNDYLAKRDAEWVAPLYEFLGMRAGVILNGMSPSQRTEQYRANVTYGTNSEFGFDYLRDNMVVKAEERVQRGHAFAIVDEVDSILIDEARTPLIISGISSTPSSEYERFAKIAPLLKSDEDYVFDEKKRTVYVTERGLDKVEGLLGEEVYADVSGGLPNHLKQALRAEVLMKRDIDYVVADGEVKIVDEFTGRIMEGRRWSDGLHQAVEAKEGVAVNSETHTLATITLQNYFRLYDKLSGMTGTAMTEDAEFNQIYSLPVIPVPTNKPVIRKDENDYIFRTADAKYRAVANEVERRHAAGQPVLVGTASIQASERLSKLFADRSIPHATLNAKNPAEEARIVAQAGRAGAVTIATNMAGRGTDILLGGSPEMLREEWLESVKADKDNLTDWQRKGADQYARYTVDREGYDVRLRGGLFVIGTERHESRRIDNQLRGRSGRQGDPGESRFYLSLEDGLLRRFGGDRLSAVASMMEKQCPEDTMPLQDALVTKVIDTAQHQVESIHFGQRKQILEYDDVLNLQRKAIYKERNAILDGKNVLGMVPEIVEDVVGEAVAAFCSEELPVEDWDMVGVRAWVQDISGADGFDAEEHIDEDSCPQDLADEIARHFESVLGVKESKIGKDAFAEIATASMLHIMDTNWLGHLENMDYLKAGIGLRSYGHRDPLVEYKDEAYIAFNCLVNDIYHAFLSTLLHLPTEGLHDAEDRLAAKNPFNPDSMVYSSPSETLDSEQNFGTDTDRPLGGA